ncbi:fibronectin type III domain-containing protein [Marinobacter sp.]|uniref:fibronectin type III domain-containing protein n=1 Tax=Marinobacter sp. TaxID=50741 RepID=UPI0019AB2AA5|nr:fibronectin type III domain-containing protein [Marinobacter sp.]MBC7192348.1 fibronectin type III domain-containing protein [Marinobacter sp.]
MKCVNKKSVFAIPVLLAGLLLAGCGGGESGQSGVQDTTTTQRQNDPVVAANKAVLSWDAPLTRVNGEGLKAGELDGYIIRYGRSEEEMTNEIEIGDEVAKFNFNPEYVIEGLDEGTWYFTIQVRDSQGLLSEPSNVVSKTI